MSNNKREYQESEDYQAFSISGPLSDLIRDYPTIKAQKWEDGKRATVEYYNIPCAFDIETSSFYEGNEKRACMYLWGLGINGRVTTGRTWQEFTKALDFLREKLRLSDNRRLIIYVHNLSYEFQWMRKWLNIQKVFALDSRKVCYCTANGIEFRCSYILSGYSLDYIGKNELRKYQIEKLTGTVDYSLIRGPETPLSETELQYQINDCLVVMAYIQEKIESDGNIGKIPLTKTGYVRRFVRKRCFVDPGKKRKEDYKRWNYLRFIKKLTIEPEEYKLLRQAFQGGFTHASPFYSGKVLENVTSIDFTSSYPSIILAEQFPMTKGIKQDVEKMTKEEFKNNLKYYCCLFTCEFFGLQATFFNDNYISRSRCPVCEKAVINNGRVVSADHLIMTITEQDFLIIMNTYKWNDLKIYNFWRYGRGLLPTDIIKATLELYRGKTELKGVEGKEVEYLWSKGQLNSIFGMMVTDIVQDSYPYDYEGQMWGGLEDGERVMRKVPELQSALDDYNNSDGRFLFYPWGVWITAYARRNIWTGILEFKNDYIYCDTDSLKVLNYNDHLEYIEKYNNAVATRLKWTMDQHKIPFEETRPKTIKGVEKPIGVYDYEEEYKRFKTLGAKRYMVEHQSGDVSITVSGINKIRAVPFLLNECQEQGKDIFDAFSDALYIPGEYTGKLTHTYIDEETTGEVRDYRGNICQYHELSSVHMEPSPYDLSIAGEYVRYLEFLQELAE